MTYNTIGKADGLYIGLNIFFELQLECVFISTWFVFNNNRRPTKMLTET